MFTNREKYIKFIGAHFPFYSSVKRKKSNVIDKREYLDQKSVSK